MTRNFEYKKEIKNTTPNINIENLTSIICDEDLEKFCKNFSEINFKPGERSDKYVLDSHDLKYIKSGDFKANLHVHTKYSDGTSSVENILDKANEIAKTNGEFIIAITDHDCVDGAKEAIEILSQNQDKYRNLKVVLGLEISTYAITLKNQKSPVSVHLLVYGINPFDTKLNEFLDKKRMLKLELAKQTIASLNKELSTDLGYEFTLEEAALVHEMVKKGLDEVAHPLKKYTAGKILHSYYCPNADFTYEKPIKKFKYLFKSSEPYYKIYKIALEKYLNKKLPEIPTNIEQYVLKAQEIYSKSHPHIGNKIDAIADFEDAVKFINSLDYGYMCIAHPARTSPLKSDLTIEEFYDDLFYNFKKLGDEKATFFEGYYQSYEGERVFNWLEIINKAAKKYNLTATGGMDSHGLDVVSRCPYT